MALLVLILAVLIFKSMFSPVLFSSNSDEWSTPQDFYNKLHLKYCFIYDLAASDENSKTFGYFTIKDDSLSQDWSDISNVVGDGWLWCNPPYSNIKAFVSKAYFEMIKGARIVMLLPSRTDTRWFHDFIYNKKGVTVEFIKGRLKFGNSKNSAPFPSMLVIFDLFHNK